MRRSRSAEASSRGGRFFAYGDPRSAWITVLRNTLPPSATHIGMVHLPDAHIEQGEPILNGLKREAEQNEGNAKDPHASLGEMIGRPFDKGRARTADYRHRADGESRFQSDGDGVIPLLRHEAAGIAGDDVADCTIHCREQLESGQTGTRSGLVIDSWPDACLIGDRLAGRAQRAKGDAKESAEGVGSA